MRLTARHVAPWIGPLVLLPLLVGCPGKNDESCETWIANLNKGSKQSSAIVRIGEQKCKDAAGPLAKLFPESVYQHEILAAVRELGPSTEAESVVRQAMGDLDLGPMAIRIAAEWKLMGLQEELEKIIRDPARAKLRRRAMEALIDVTTPETSAAMMVWLAGEDPAVQGADVNGYAAERLALVDWTKVDKALLPQAVDNLIKCTFLKDTGGRSAKTVSRMAIWALGGGAVQPILDTFQGRNQALNEALKARGISDWQFTQGRELVELLWDLGDRSVSPRLMAALAKPLVMPEDLKKKTEADRDEWRMANANRLSLTALTVGALLNDEAVPAATKVLEERTAETDIAQFQKAGLALGLMGTPAAREVLWRLFRVGSDKSEAARNRMTEIKMELQKLKKPDDPARTALMIEHDKLVDDLHTVARARARFVENLAIGLGPKEREEYKKSVVEAADKEIQDAGKDALAKGYFDVVDRCAEDGECYLKALESVKGKLAELPKGIDAADAALEAAKKDVAAKAKPLGELLKEKKKALEEQRIPLQEFKTKVEENPKATKAEKEELKAKLEAFDAAVAEIDKLLEDRNKLAEELDKPKEAVEAAKRRLHEVEKAVLTIDDFPALRARAIPALGALYAEASGGAYEQLKQWILIALEHMVDTNDLGELKRLLEQEKQKDEMSFWTFRLTTLVKRLERVAKK